MPSVNPPIAIHFIWHPFDHEEHYQIIDKVRQYLTRDIDRPFSRELNIPTFLYSSRTDKKKPKSLKKLAENDLVFLFLSENTLINCSWNDYINEIPSSFHIIPVALDHHALKHASNGNLKNKNFIRSYNWPYEDRLEYAILELSHEIFRFSFNDVSIDKKGTDLSLKIFLSHAKQDDNGINLAIEIKNFIDNTSMKRFFDATDIAPCYNFDEEIKHHLKESTIIAIASDNYSSRYWCQREILLAKEERRPIIFADSLEYYEDRIFPASSNIPNIHISHDTTIKNKEILRVLIAALIETIRFNYAKLLLEYYRKQEWIHKDSELFSRPPEVNQVIKLLQDRKMLGKSQEILHLCYPEPPVYPEEISWINHFENKLENDTYENKVQAVTPLWSIFDGESDIKKIGLSISEYKEDQFESHNQHIDELKRLAQVISDHLLLRGHTLVYGGDLRDDGFTQFILDEALIIQNRTSNKEIKIENHLAWPLFMTDNNKKFKVKYHNLININEYDIPKDIEHNKNIYLPPNCPENKYIWSRCLTEMREKSIKNSDIRIIAGGKCENYLGKMPGILEEFIISLRENKPIYLLGGFGGLSAKIKDSILNKEIAPELTQEWQNENNDGYSELQKIAKQSNKETDYQVIENIITSISLKELSNRSGLTIDDYSVLLETSFIDQAVHLILKGLKNLK